MVLQPKLIIKGFDEPWDAEDHHRGRDWGSGRVSDLHKVTLLVGDQELKPTLWFCLVFLLQFLNKNMKKSNHNDSK